MWILALDSALARCSAAVRGDAGLAAAASVDGPRGHASVLPPLAERVLREAGITAARLDAVAAVVGPGGFTGLRAGLALAQGIALAVGVPALGVTTGEAIAAGLPAALRQGRELWVVVDNRRGRVILERFAPGSGLPEPLGPPEACELDSLPAQTGPLLLAGDGAEALAARLPEALLTAARLAEPGAVAEVAAARWRGAIPARAALPLYVEPPAVRLPGAGNA